jgi:hypothetical protein
LTLLALVFLDVHLFQLFATEEHFDQSSNEQSVSSIHPHVLMKESDILLNAEWTDTDHSGPKSKHKVIVVSNMVDIEDSL